MKDKTIYSIQILSGLNIANPSEIMEKSFNKSARPFGNSTGIVMVKV